MQVRPARASVDRQDDREGGAFSALAVDAQPPAVAVDDVLHDGEAKTGAAALATAKSQEQIIPLPARNAGPVIGDINDAEPTGPPDIDSDQPRPGGGGQ